MRHFLPFVRLALMGLALGFESGFSAQRTWTGGDGAWADPAHWSPFTGGVPLGNDAVVIGGGAAVSLVSGTQPASGSLLSLHVGAVAGGGGGSVTQQNGTLQSNLAVLGMGAGNTGRLEVGDGLLSVGRAYVGRDQGTGMLIQTGGVVRLTGAIGFSIGENAGSSGVTRGLVRIDGGQFVALQHTVAGQATAAGTDTEGRIEVNGGSLELTSLILGSGPGAVGWVEQRGGRMEIARGPLGWTTIAGSVGARGAWIASGGTLEAHASLEVAPRASSDGLLLMQGEADVRARSLLVNTVSPGQAARVRVELQGGTLRVDTLTLGAASTNLHWGSTTITPYTSSGAEGTVDATEPGNDTGPFVSHGRTLLVTKAAGAGGAPDLRTGSGANLGGTDPANASVLDLGPLYAQSGTRHNRLLIQQGGDLDLTAPGDALRLSGVVTPLRPRQGADRGTLTLVLLEGGGEIRGEFDAFEAPQDDGLGFAASSVDVTAPSQLAPGTYDLEYRTDRILLHYHVAVPDPVLEPVAAAPEALTYRVAPGRAVWLEESPSLSPPSWTRSSLPVRFEGQVAVWDSHLLEALTSTQRYFRVVTAEP